MKPSLIFFTVLLALSLVGAKGIAADQGGYGVTIEKPTGPGNEKPILVSLSGFEGEAAQVLRFDLYVQGYAFTNAENAQFLLSGSANGAVQGQLKDRANQVLFSKAYSGAALRRQAHALADDVVAATRTGMKGIGQTKLAFKGENGRHSEVYIADFDTHGLQAVTADNAIVAAPCWVPRHFALCYVSYRLNNADIYSHDLGTGARRAIARYGGSNMSPAVSPDGSRVAMILSKDGWTDLYVANIDGSNVKRLTKSPQDESSPCWSPDGRTICYAAKDKERRTLCLISASGGEPKRLAVGVSSPSEPDWSPDGKYIAFTSQYAGGFSICVVEAKGGTATVLCEGEDPSWAPNSRTLAYARRPGRGGNYVLSLLDVPTKQYKDVSRISGMNSQSQPSWAK